MLAVIGSTPLASRLADLLGERGPVVRLPSPDAPTAEGRLAALSSLERADAAVAATGEDERSLVAASLARRMGAARAAAVVESPSLAARADLAAALTLDRILQPEAELAGAILGVLAGPAAEAVRSLGAGRIRVMELRIGEGSIKNGRTLGDLSLPAGSRVALIRRAGKAIAPSARAELAPDDRVLLVANATVAADAAARLGAGGESSVRVAIIAGPDAGARAERLAAALHGEADVEAEVLPAKQAQGIPASVAAVILLGTPAGAGERVRSASPGVRLVAVDADPPGGSGVSRLTTEEVLASAALSMLPRPPVERLGSIEPGALDVYRVEAGEGGDWLGVPLKEVPGLRGWTILAIQAGRNTHMPHPQDAIGPKEVVIIAGPTGSEAALRKGLRGD